MIINNSYGFIFVHVPKTAGTSVTSVLSRLTSYLDQEVGGTEFGEAVQPAFSKRFGLKKHSTALEIKGVVGDVTWNRYFSFSFVRNPFSRCLSTYYFLREWKGAGPDFQRDMQAFRNFEDFVLSGMWNDTNGPDDIFQPQVHWLKGRARENNNMLDFVGRVENLNDDLKYCLHVVGDRKISGEFQEAPILNTSPNARKRGAISDRATAQILRKYEIDFRTFGYSTEVGESEAAGPLSLVAGG